MLINVHIATTGCSTPADSGAGWATIKGENACKTACRLISDDIGFVRAYQWSSHGEVLCHSHKSLIHSRVSMWMKFTQHFSHHSCTLSMGLFGCETKFMHCIYNPSVCWFKTISYIWESSANHHRHSIL